jgi:hypothetical protein
MGKRRMLVFATCIAALMGVGAGSAFAGEITGNGKLKEPNGNSECSFSGQEDLQWYTSDGNAPETRIPEEDVVKGEPAHSQNWGHVKQATGLPGGAGPAGCNAREFGTK